MSAYKSKIIDELLVALEKAKTYYKSISLSRDNNFSLSTVASHAHVSLRKNDLRLLYYVEALEEDNLSLQRTQLVHESGQYITIASNIIIKDSKNPNNLMSLAAVTDINGLLVLGIKFPVITDEKSVEFMEKITPEQWKDLMWELDDFPDVVKGILKFYNIDSLTELPKLEFQNAKVKIRKIKKSHES